MITTTSIERPQLAVGAAPGRRTTVGSNASEEMSISVPIQFYGICVFSWFVLCKLDHFGQDLIAVGGLKRCPEAMKLHNSDTDLQTYGCIFFDWEPMGISKCPEESCGRRRPQNSEKCHGDEWSRSCTTNRLLHSLDIAPE
jgi:hypothetical protein